MKTLFAAALTTTLMLIATSSQAGEERRLVGYANGKPMYVKGGAFVRAALPVRSVSYASPARRCRVNVGCSQITHGPTYFGGGNYYSGDYGGYGWGGGGYYESGSYCPPMQGHCQPARQCSGNAGRYVQPFQAAASRGYSWIPRYGSTTHIPKYPR